MHPLPRAILSTLFTFCLLLGAVPAAVAEPEPRTNRMRGASPSLPAASATTGWSSTSGRAAAVDVALAQVGKPYRWGGSGPNSYDCSGLTSYAWRKAGVTLPHSSRRQYRATSRVSRSNLRPGDLVFYYSPVSHVAMYVGDGKVVEAPNRGGQVRVASLSRPGYTGAGRP